MSCRWLGNPWGDGTGMEVAPSPCAKAKGDTKKASVCTGFKGSAGDVLAINVLKQTLFS